MTTAVRLAGFSGHLVSESFLAADASASDASEADVVRRTMMESHATALARLGPSSTPRTILDSALAPLIRRLGFERPDATDRCGAALVATARADGRAVCILVTPWAERLDAYWRPAVVEARRRSAAWALLFNGVGLRIVDAGRLYSRRFVGIDLALALDHEASFAALWRLLRPESLCATALDPQSLHAIVDASDRHAASVCRSLRVGVLAASTDLLRALVVRERPPRAPIEQSFEQAVTIAYRILFLLFAEARSLVPLWHPVYRESYSVEALCEIAERSSTAPGFWDALRAMARLAHAGCRAGDLRVTPFNGRLFAPARTPLAERRDLDDGLARRAVLALSNQGGGAGSPRIMYRDLGVEQLGAVYETLLDYQPVVSHAPAVRRRVPSVSVTLERGAGTRKTTGTFYTPQPVADYVVRRTLGPLVRDKAPDDILRLRVVDPAMGSGAFLVAACRYLASSYERALVDCGRCHGSDLDDAARAGIRRLVAERCLYGVDLNPMAVQLARLSLWLATLAADRPLSFLDHRLAIGDSLLGAWLTNLRRRPARRATGRAARLPLFPDDIAIDALKAAMPIRFSLESMPNDTVEQVRAKERQLAALSDSRTALSRWKRIADLWCAVWFGDASLSVPASAFDALVDAVLGAVGPLPLHRADAYLKNADAIVRRHRFFHWELEFPEVFFDPDGRRLAAPGFDAVIGNPPWDMMRADTGERSFRSRARAALAAAVRFTRDAGVYTAQTNGHANRYQLFVERAMDLTRHGGRLGLVLPSGLTTDHGSADLRRQLLERCDVDALAGVDNHRGIFPIHRGVRFLLLTASAGSPTRQIACRFGIESPAELEALGDDDAAAPASSFPLRLSPATVERLSGPSLTVPQLRHGIDLAICDKAAALFPPLGDDRGWAARFGRELNATEDRDAFRESDRGLFVLEGKHLEPFRVARDRTTRRITRADAAKRLGAARVGRPRLGYRDVASATNRLTLIAAIVPADCVSTHTVFCLRTTLPAGDQAFLCGLFNSFVVNYLVRLRTTTHVTTATVERLPLPLRDTDPAAYRAIAARAMRLARRPDPEALAALNARVAELYQLTREEFDHILGTFPLIEKRERDAAARQFLGHHDAKDHEVE